MDATLPPGFARIDFKNPTPFLIRTGEEIGRLQEYLGFIKDGHKPLFETLIPHFEREAIDRLERVTKVLKKWHPVYKENPEAWRIWWLKEAYCTYVCKDTTHQKIVDAACNILKKAAELRAAMETGNPEKIATLAMLLILEIIQGGNELERDSLDHENYDYQTKEWDGKIREDERVANSIGKNAKFNEEVQRLCPIWAKKTWEKHPEMRMTEMAEECLKNIHHSEDKLPDNTKFPKINTIKDWLKAADKKGKLKIPEAAKRRGRPAKIKD